MIIRINREKNGQKLFALMLMIFMGILLLGNYYNADYRTYEDLYDRYYANNWYYNQEIGYIILNKISIGIGLSFFEFKNILLSIAFIMIFVAIKRMSSEVKYNSIPILCLYFFSGFLSDIIQIRMYLAGGLIIFGLSYLYEKKLKNIMLFSILLCLGITIHISTIVYAVFYSILFIRKTKHMRKAIAIAALFMAIGGNLFINKISELLLLLSDTGIRDVGDFELGNYFTAKFLILLIISLFLAWLFENDGYYKNVNDYISKINLFFPAFVVIACFNASGGRFLRVVSIFYYIDILRRINNGKTKYKYLYLVMLLLIAVLIGGTYWVPGTTTFEQITMPIFKYNYLLGGA